MIFSATKTNNTGEDKYSEPNSLREVLLFCAVLVVEAYGLAVAFGGPFFEVGYFLLVVISQTLAGAYVWAQLRHTDRSLPLPELLAMGFAIGSASAAISQLIIRDLLGIRLFISPLVPIIGVAIWLVTRRNPQLPVTITHANTNTLLWLLFPAPLAIMREHLILIPLYLVPLCAVSVGHHKAKKIESKLTTKTSAHITLTLFLSTFLVSIITKFYMNTGSGIARITGDDQSTDIVHAIGFSVWGLSTNVELVGYTNAYYKISHLWIGPVIGFDGTMAVNITTLILPVFLILMISLGLWVFTFRISADVKAAALAPALFLLQADIQDSVELNFRFVWLLGTFYLITFGQLAQRLLAKPSYLNAVGLVAVGFVIAGTRISFLPWIIPITIFIMFTGRLSLKRFLRDQTILLGTLSIGTLVAYFVFVREAKATLIDYLLLSASDWPMSLQTNAIFIFSSTIGRTGLFFGALLVLKKFNSRFSVTSVILVFVLATLLIPRVTARDTTILLPFLLIISPVFAVLITESFRSVVQPNRTRNAQLIFGLCIGLLHKIIFDMYREKPPSDNFLRVIQYEFATNPILLTINLTILSVLFVFGQLGLLKTLQRSAIIASVVITIFASNAGVMIGAHLRPITEYFRYGETFWSSKPDPLVSRWSDKTILNGISNAKSLSNFDDTFASNFGLSRNSGPNDNLRVQILIRRKLYISSRYKYFSDSFPLIFRKNYDNNLNLNQDANSLRDLIEIRLNTSMDFPNYPSRDLLANLLKENVKWFVVDLGRTELRDWEPYATTRFMNEKVAILELALLPAPSD